MGLYERKNFTNDLSKHNYESVLRMYAIQLGQDSHWFQTRIDMYLARYGRQWYWTEEARAAEKNLPVMTYNVISNLIEQKVALIADIDSPAEFNVSSESTGESDVNRKAMLFLNYSYAKSGGSRLFERGVELTCTVGQDMQYFEPMYNPVSNEFYIKFSRIPFYRYRVLGAPKQEYFSDAGGLIIIEDITMSEVSRRLSLDEKGERALYAHRYTTTDFVAHEELIETPSQRRRVNELNRIFSTDSFKEFYFQQGFLEEINGSAGFDFKILRDTMTVRVITHISRSDLETVYKVERTGNLDAILAAKTPEEALAAKKPNWNYPQRIYFEEELKRKRKLPNGDAFTLMEFIDEDVENGFAVKTPLRMRPITVRKYYGKAFYEEFKYATEEYPFTPMHRVWQDDKYSTGDVDAIYDIQRSYNEQMTVINATQNEMYLGERYIFSNEITFSNGGDGNDALAQQKSLEELLSGSRRAIFANFPKTEGEKYIRISSQPVAPEFIRYVYEMPNQMMQRMGLQPYLLGEGGQPRTTADAQSRTNFGTAQIKSVAYSIQRSVAEHARKALIYAQLESKLNLEIEVGEERVKYNEIRFDEQIGRYIVANELKFDGSPLRVSFRGTEYHKNFRIKQTILELLRFMPQGSPVMQLLVEMLIKLEEIPELDKALEQSAQASDFQMQLRQREQQLQVLSKEMMNLEAQNAKLKVDMDVQRRIAINREKINRELNKLVSQIRAMSEQVQHNAEKEAAVQMTRIKASAEAVLDILNKEGDAAESTLGAESATATGAEMEEMQPPPVSAVSAVPPVQNPNNLSDLVAPPVPETDDAIPAPL